MHPSHDDGTHLRLISRSELARIEREREREKLEQQRKDDLVKAGMGLLILAMFAAALWWGLA